MLRQRAISLRRSSGVGWVNAVSIPSPPALETAEASSAVPTHCMPPWMIGYLIPSNSVTFVFIVSLFLAAQLACLRSSDYAEAVETRFIVFGPTEFAIPE